MSLFRKISYHDWEGTGIDKEDYLLLVGLWHCAYPYNDIPGVPPKKSETLNFRYFDIKKYSIF